MNSYSKEVSMFCSLKIKSIFFVLFSFIFFTTHSISFSQSWNPFEPKDFDECIIKNLKPGMSDEAVKALQYSCIKKYPPKSSDAEKLVEKKLDERLKKCRLEKDHYKTHMFLAIGKIDSYKTSEIISKLKTFKYDGSLDKVGFQNMNPFGISGVAIGFTNDKQCPQKAEDYRFSTYCTDGFTERGVASNAYGFLSCGQLPKEAKAMGFCPIGYSPMYNQFNESLLDFLEKNKYCN
jgi:hypothetical protein